MSLYLKPAFLLLVIFTALTGVLYPVAVTGLGQLLFPRQANGSLLADKDGKALGSELVGQAFTDPAHFWGRPSATTPYAYNAGASSGSNQGPTNPALAEAVKVRIQVLRAADPDNRAPIPVDLVTASGSGLDPHISPAAAEYQVGRVARARGLNPAKLREWVELYTEGRQFGILGEARVNVLDLNRALDTSSSHAGHGNDVRGESFRVTAFPVPTLP